MIRINNFEFRTVFTNDLTEKYVKFFLWFLHFLIKLWLSKGFQLTQSFKKHQWNFINSVSSYFRSIVTQNRAIAAKNGCGRAKTACSPRFFKLEIFSFGICLDILQTTQKDGARHDWKNFHFWLPNPNWIPSICRTDS